MTSRKDVEQIKTVKIKQSDLNSLVTKNGAYEIRYRLVDQEASPVSDWTPVISVSLPTIPQEDSRLRLSALGNNDYSLSFLKKYEFPAYDIFIYIVEQIVFSNAPFTGSLKNRPNNTHAIYFTTVPHFLKPNMRVSVAGGGANYNTSNALITAANDTSFTMTGGLTAVTSATNVAAAGTITVINANTANSLSNSDYYFFDRVYDRPGASTFFTSFTIKDLYAVKAGSTPKEIFFDPSGNILTAVSALPEVVKYTLPVTTNNVCMAIAIQPATVAENNTKPVLVGDPNLILAKTSIL